MRSISPATPISLTFEERAALEALANSRKSEARMRDRARIELLAADGLASRAIGRAVVVRHFAIQVLQSPSDRKFTIRGNVRLCLQRRGISSRSRPLGGHIPRRNNQRATDPLPD